MYRVPLVFTPQPEGGYTVTSPVLPELITEGDSLEEARTNVQDALHAVVEIYEEQGRVMELDSRLRGNDGEKKAWILPGAPGRE
jgi:antitoxin HicB